MDDRRFDAFTRSLATGLSRRRVLKGLFGGAVLGGAAATRLDQAAAQVCDLGQFVCDGECCPNANNCCGGDTCCPPGQCNQTEGVCCESFEFACGTDDNTCCNSAEEKCCDGICISRNLCCPSLPDCGPCEACVEGSCRTTCATNEECCTATVAAPFCAECCDVEDCPICWVCDLGTCVQNGFECGTGCCQLDNNCCGDVCCPSSQCNEEADVCCLPTEFACGAGDNACCDIQTEKCCDGECISAGLCCPSLPDCPEGLTCCEGVCEDLQNDPTNCGACAADCSAGLLCCQGVCRECCDNENCDPCDRCVDGICAPLLCEDPCEFCDLGVDACVPACPENEHCCVFGPPEDVTIECVDGDECCETDECGECAHCINGFCEPDIILCELGSVPCCVNDELICTECCHDSDCEDCTHCVDGTCEPDVIACIDGVACCINGELLCTECCDDSNCNSCETCENYLCVPKFLPCPLGQVTCCVGDELFCSECCDDSDCDTCHLCHQGRCVPCEAGGLECCVDVCVPPDECCVDFGHECGVLEVTSAGGYPPPQLDCCDGLVCCETKYGSVCAECCTDHECPKGSICCLGECREIECCIDDILVGLDPNRRCPDGCSCFEGICDCHCQSSKDCAYGTCCCKDGTCSEHCCEKGCDYDKDCAYGACCCHDGSCSSKCCKTYTPPITYLPDTGSGSDASGSGFAGVAAIGAMAAYFAARKLRQQQSEEITAEE